MKVITWNTARTYQTLFKNNSDVLIPDAENFDIIVITCQEVLRENKKIHLVELETFLLSKGFVNIEDSFNGMWELIMIVFVKSQLHNAVSSVKKMQIAKDKYKSGTKGGIAYGFVFAGKVFNFYAVHL